MTQKVGFKGVFDDKDIVKSLYKMETGIGKVNDEFEDMAKIQKRGFGSMRDGLRKNNKAIQEGTKSFSQFGSTFKAMFGSQVALGAVNAMAQGLKNLASGAINAAAGYESTQISFEVFLGSAEKAQEVLADLEKFSLATPFEPTQVNDAGKALLAFGIQAEDLIPTLKSIGDISAGTGKDFNELAVIYGKARTQGTLFAEDINQLTEAGVPIIQEFAKQFGVAESQVKKLGSEGKISFANLEQAFKDMTGEGGKFFELTAKQSKSFSGLMSTAKGAFNSLLREAGNVFLPIAKEMLPRIINGMFAVLDAVRPVVSVIKQTVGPIFSALKSTVSPLSDSMKSFGDRMKAFANNNESLSKFATTTAKISKAVGSLFGGLFKLGKTLVDTALKLNPFRMAMSKSKLTLEGVAGFVSGVGSALTAMASNARIATQRMVLDFKILAEKAKKYGKEIISLGRADTSDSDAIILDLEAQKEGLEAGLLSIVEAYKKGVDDVNKIDIKIPEKKKEEIVNSFGDTGKKAVEEMTKEAEKALKEYDKLLDTIAAKIQDADLASKVGADLVNAQADIELAKINELEKALVQAAEASGKSVTAAEINNLKKLRDAVNKQRREDLEALKKTKQEEVRELNEAVIKEQLAHLDTEKTLQETKINNEIKEEEERVKALLEVERKYLLGKLYYLSQSRNADQKELDIISEQIKSLDRQINSLGLTNPLQELKKKIHEGLKEALNLNDQELEALIATIGVVFDSIGSGFTQNINRQIEENARLLDSIRERIDETESILEDESEKQKEGYANNVESKRKELEELKKEEAKAEKERVKLRKQQLKAQLASDSIQQLSGMVTMASGILAQSGKLGPILGPILAAAAIFSMTQLYKNYKSEAKALTSERAFKGGPVDQFLGGRSDKYGGRGHKVEDSNLVLGGDEFIIRGQTTKKQRSFLESLNRGLYDDIDIHSLARSHRRGLLKPGIVSGRYAERLKRRDLFRKGSLTRSEMESIMSDHAKTIQGIYDSRPVVYTIEEGTKQVIFMSDGKVKKINLE